MHATMRYYPGNTGLADELAGRADEIRSVISGVPGFQAYYLVKLDDATVSITVCDDEAGTAESTRVAAEWIKREHARPGGEPADGLVGDGDAQRVTRYGATAGT